MSLLSQYCELNVYLGACIYHRLRRYPLSNWAENLSLAAQQVNVAETARVCAVCTCVCAGEFCLVHCDLSCRHGRGLRLPPALCLAGPRLQAAVVGLLWVLSEAPPSPLHFALFVVAEAAFVSGRGPREREGQAPRTPCLSAHHFCFFFRRAR